MTFLRSKDFWRPGLVACILFALFFTWELGYFGDLLPRLSRPEPTQLELIYTVFLIALLSLDAGLVFFRIKQGTCPIGARRASAIAGGLGVITLLCPVCLLLPISLFGLTLSLAALTPYLPLLRVITVFLLVVSTFMLWPKKG